MAQSKTFPAGKYPKFSLPDRQNASDSRLYAFATIPTLDTEEEAYQAEIVVSIVDHDVEQTVANHFVRCINTAPTVIDAMEFALQKLDSVAFLSKPGDTQVAKNSLRNALAKLTGIDPAR